MADAAFRNAKYPAYTTDELKAFLAEGRDGEGHMAAEIDRRERVAAGDVSVMTDGERLRFARKGGAK